uniref:Uncharacterized protein n=1 Tax=Chelydra serpentina TaxID=8475 RepID=A0A8C3T8U8_CHESE
MSYCVGLQYYCKLGAANQAVHIYYFKNQQSYYISVKSAGNFLCKTAKKHPPFRPHCLLGSVSFYRRQMHKKPLPSCISPSFPSLS